MALLFEDILVFLERSNENEKRRYILRPLLYTFNRTKQLFTPVIPLACINSFGPMHEKRQFHLVVIIEDHAKSKQSNNSSAKIQTQMLFLFIAKSGDERNKWTHHLQELTGKMSQTNNQGPSIDLNSTQSSSSLLSLTQTQQTLNASVSSSAIISSPQSIQNTNGKLVNTDQASSSSSLVNNNSSSDLNKQNIKEQVNPLRPASGSNRQTERPNSGFDTSKLKGSLSCSFTIITF